MSTVSISSSFENFETHYNENYTQNIEDEFRNSENDNKIGNRMDRVGVGDNKIYELEESEVEIEKGKKWGEWIFILFKTISLLTLLFFFVCSLDLLSIGFRLLGGKTAVDIFKNSEIFQNPIVMVMIGVLTTVLLQSSSTSSSLVVSMVSAGILDVRTMAIFIIMGVNIGTSVTSTIVAITQGADRDQFRRAFAAATVLDMFNWLCVIVLLIVEVTTGYLYHLTNAIMKSLTGGSTSGGGEILFLTALTRPFVNLIAQVDREVLDCYSMPNCTHANSSLLKEFCESRNTKIEMMNKVKNMNGDVIYESFDEFTEIIPRKCNFIFAGMDDKLAGILILIISLFVLCVCLILVVKLLNSVLQGSMAKVVTKTLNADFPKCSWISGYLAILVGMIFTILVQSSSVFTSALTPLVGLDAISLERAYPLVLGANIGTVFTSILASLAVEDSFFPSMQIALVHLFFNLTGVLLFYPIPFLRFPLNLARFLGNTVAKYRWFALVYLILMFVLVPCLFIGLSFAGSTIVIVFVSIIGLFCFNIGIIKILQHKWPEKLPEMFRNWKWLPIYLRSLQPYDNLFSKCNCCKKCGQRNKMSDTILFTSSK